MTILQFKIIIFSVQQKYFKFIRFGEFKMIND